MGIAYWLSDRAVLVLQLHVKFWTKLGQNSDYAAKKIQVLFCS